MNRYLLCTLGPGTTTDSAASIIVVEYPGWKVVDSTIREHGIYAGTHKGFSGASLQHDGQDSMSGNGADLVVSNECEIIEFALAPLTETGAFSESFLNDVHHVIHARGEYIVVNTGLDCLEYFDAQKKHVGTKSLIKPFRRPSGFLSTLCKDDMAKSWKRLRGGFQLYGHLQQRMAFRNVRKHFRPLGIRQSSKDLRQFDLRPHYLHPNHVTLHGDETWVSLWRPGQIINADDGAVISDGLGRPHDGMVFDSELFITDCSQCRVVVDRVENGRVAERRVDRQIDLPDGNGFLRGLAPFETDMFVGVTAHRKKGSLPFARIARVDRETGDYIEHWTVPREHGALVYSVLDVTAFYAT